jgi:hypothetical protein
MGSGYRLLSPSASDLEEEPPATFPSRSSKFQKSSRSFQYTALPVPYDSQNSTSSSKHSPGKQQRVLRSEEDIEDHENIDSGDSEDDDDDDSESSLLLTRSKTQRLMHMLRMEPKIREMKTSNRR